MGVTFDPLLGQLRTSDSYILAVGAAIIGGTDTRILFDDGGLLAEDAGFTFSKTPGVLTLGGKTVTTSQPTLDISQTFNAGAVVFSGMRATFTNTASAALSQVFEINTGAGAYFGIGGFSANLGVPTLWLGTAAKSTSNYTLQGNSGTVTINATGTVALTINNTANLVELKATGLTLTPASAIPAGGSTTIGYKATSTANFGVFFGSGAPTLSAAKGSLYLRSDGTGTADRAYINTNGTTTWTNLVTAA